MSSAKPDATRAKASGKATSAPRKPAPLIPEHKKYVYRPSQMNAFVQNIVTSARAKKLEILVPRTPYATIKLVHTLCSASQLNYWSPECEKALNQCLPLREHNKAFLSHNLFVTMIGTVVARALEQATRGCDDTLDLLSDRYYVRSIACHDSSKTSKTESAAYAGIMAVHIEKEALFMNEKKRDLLNKYYGAKQTEKEVKNCSLNKLYSDTEDLTTPMANFGFKHHYEMNNHHPEHFPGGEMDDIHLVEAIVDGLACIFERNKDHTDVQSWLKMYYVERFKGSNKDLAQNIIEALKLYITVADYETLQKFRKSISDIIGESIPWSHVVMTDCCNPKSAQDSHVSERDLASCFSMKK